MGKSLLGVHAKLEREKEMKKMLNIVRKKLYPEVANFYSVMFTLALIHNEITIDKIQSVLRDVAGASGICFKDQVMFKAATQEVKNYCEEISNIVKEVQND